MVRLVRRRRRPCTILNVFFYETAWLIKAKFYAEPSWEGGNESLYKWHRSHGQEDRHILFGKTFENLILQNRKSYDL